MVSVEWRSKELERALAKLAAAARVGYGDVVREEARYVTQTLIKVTPPKSRKQGEGAINTDFGLLTKQLNYDTFKRGENSRGFYRSMARYIERRDFAKMQLLLNNPNIGRDFYGRQLLKSPSEIAQVHLQRRSRRGRVTGGQGYFASFKVDSDRVMKEIQSRVGWTASGWIPAARATGARFKKFSDRFGGRSGGQISHFGANPFIRARNYKVKIPSYQSTVDFVLRSRIGTTLKKIDRLNAGLAVNLGFIRVKGLWNIRQDPR